MRRIILLLLTTCVLLMATFLLLSFQPSANSDDTLSSDRVPTPNILILLADDWGWGDLHANLADEKPSNTPNIDKLATDGIRFTDFHTASSVCTPSRAALLTGRMGLRTGMNAVLGPYNVGGLPLEEITIADLLKQLNFSTFALGKWHLGHNGRYHPNERGFDHYYGVPYSLDQGCLDYAGYIHPPRKTCADETSTYFVGLPLFKDKKIIEQPLDIRKLSDLQVNEFEKRIIDIKKSNSNFFSYVAFNHMHVPLGFSSRYRNVTKTVYGDTLRELDHSIGQMINILKKNRMYDNTMIWLLGDNGPWEQECQYGGSAGPFRGLWQRAHGGGTASKLEVWEGGHRVPGIVSWPNVIQSNRVSNALVSSLDILPTIASVLDINLPDDRRYDGRNIKDVLAGKTEHAHEALFHPRSDGRGGHISAVRYKNYKAVYETGGKFLKDCAGTEAPHRFFNPPLLFDLHADVAEKYPLDTNSSQHRDILDEVAKLLKMKLLDIKTDKRGKFDARRRDAAQPCCNKKKKFCRC